jgi:PAS domain S-box-containing protein
VSAISRVSVVTVVGGEPAARERWAAELRGSAFTVVLAESATTPVAEGDSDGVCLVIGGGNARRDGAGALLDTISAVRRTRPRAIVIACLSRSEADAVQASIASGADDVMLVPPPPGELAARVRNALAHANARTAAVDAERFGAVMLGAGAMIRDGVDLEEQLSDWLQSVCDAVALHRGILLLRTDDEASALLVGASDDAGLNRVPLDLDRYPEVRACLETQAEIVVEEARASALLGPWAELAAQHGGESIVAVPLVDGGRSIGALLLRSRRARPDLSTRALEFLRSAAALLVLLLRSSGSLAALREQTRRTSIAKHESERRARALERHRDFLDSAPEAMFIVEADGTILYVNRAVEQLTGYRRDGLESRSIDTVIEGGEREALFQRIRIAAGGQALPTITPEWFDLVLTTTSGESVLVSASISMALADVGAALLSCRDITESRALEAELQKTKDFLERLIDSTVDGIVAADLRGRVILFNQGAARLTGWSAEELVGKVPVWKLYPHGQAQAIMRALRGGQGGQPGRLEPSRLELIGKSGQLVPVSLTASMVYEGGREVATVGVISDLREQLRIEERLAFAQEKLMVSERQAVIAELAGATAHELNQPLTSVMGYSELLKKRMVPSDPHYRAVDTILREAERMAEIVRKIGRITRYETKAYVGGTQIIDLEKSTHHG